MAALGRCIGPAVTNPELTAINYLFHLPRLAALE